jgi:hypothetical protein
MSAFYDLASLVVVPSGYKSGKVYAQKPLTTDGQLAFTRASTATRVNASGLVEAVASGVPRLDYLGSTCPKLLLEPQRTNGIIYSEAFTSWYAPADGVTLTANTTETLSPDGTNNASKIEIVGGAKRTYEITSSSAGAGTFSLFVKAGTSTNITLFTSSGSISVGYNLTSQVVNPTTGTGTITSYGNGWFRITASGTLVTSEVLQLLYTGSAGQTLYIWGAMVESGAYATSYVKTTGASVTRVADAASKTGISSLIGQQEGVWYWEGNLPQASENGANSSVGLINTARNVNSTTAISFQHVSGTSRIITALWVGNGTFIPVVEFYANGYTSGTYVKIAFAYKSGSSALYVNGTLVDSSSASFTSSTSMSEIYYHDNTVYYGYTGQQKLAQSLLFKTRLTNAQLSELSAL